MYYSQLSNTALLEHIDLLDKDLAAAKRSCAWITERLINAEEELRRRNKQAEGTTGNGQDWRDV